MKKLVILTGAGVSAESGLKTFRDEDGLWEGFNIEDVATATAWRRNPAIVLEFYNQRRKSVIAARPNAAHYALADLEKEFDVHVITQNIDDLHERAGSSNVLHLHGEILKMRSETNYNLVYPIVLDISVGDRAEDDSQLRPHIVWFEEPVPMMDIAAGIVSEADIFAVIGTSLVVYPAASLIHYAATSIPKFIIDKKIPTIVGGQEFHLIEKPASEGVPVFADILRSNWK